MIEKIYSHVIKIHVKDYGRKEEIKEIMGSQEELDKLLEDYSIKKHTQNTDNTIDSGGNSYGVTIISNHYILVKKVLTKV